MVSGIGNEAQIEAQVVYACDLHSQQLLGFEEVVQIGFGVKSVDVAAVGVDGGEVVFPFLRMQPSPYLQAPD